MPHSLALEERMLNLKAASSDHRGVEERQKNVSRGTERPRPTVAPIRPEKMMERMVRR